MSDLGDYPVVVHGTNAGAWARIKVSGLNKMGRQHVHFAKGLPGEGGVISGMRKGSEVMVYLDLAGAVRDSIPFFVSANGVVLSPGEGDTGVVPTKYFKDVIYGKTGESILNNDTDTATGTAASAGKATSVDLPTLLARATELTEAEKERWQQLHDEGAALPKVAGKPDPAVMAQMKAHKTAQKVFVSGLSPEAKKVAKQLDAAAKKLKTKVRANQLDLALLVFGGICVDHHPPCSQCTNMRCEPPVPFEAHLHITLINRCVVFRRL